MDYRLLPNGNLELNIGLEEGMMLLSMPHRLREVIENPDFDQRVARRLLPTAYREDPEREAEFRELVGTEIRQRKLDHLWAFEKSLREAMDVDGAYCLQLDSEQMAHWCGFLNDARLLLGTLLDIEEDWYEEYSDPEGEASPDEHLYAYLTNFQGFLIQFM